MIQSSQKGHENIDHGCSMRPLTYNKYFLMKYLAIIFGLTLTIFLSGCRNADWDEHYSKPSDKVDKNIWTAIQEDPDLSTFVQYVKEYEFDTLFRSQNTYTVFAPTNEAFSQLTDTVDQALIAYHISTFFIQSSDIIGKRKIQTFNLKFALFDNSNST